MDDINGKICLAGYSAGKKGIIHSEGLVFESKYRYDDGYALAERLISFKKATAAIVTGDEPAQVLNDLLTRVSVPEDFEIITSDDHKLRVTLVQIQPPLCKPLRTLVLLGMRMLTKIMHKGR